MANARASLAAAGKAAKALGNKEPKAMENIPREVLGVLFHGKYAESEPLRAAIASYNTLIWVSQRKTLDKALYFHIYKMIRASKLAEVMDELRKMGEHQTIIDYDLYRPLAPAPLNSPESILAGLEPLGTFFYRNAWDIGEKTPPWVSKRSIPEESLTEISRRLAAEDVVSKLDLLLEEDIPYVLANMIANMSSLEGAATKEGACLGRYVLYEASRYLARLAKSAPPGAWILVKKFRAALLMAAHPGIKSDISEIRAEQHDLFFHKMTTSNDLSYWLELGKLVNKEMTLNASSTSSASSAVAWYANALYVAEQGEDLLGVSIKGRGIPYLLEKLEDRMSNKSVLSAYTYYHYLNEPPQMALPPSSPMKKMSKTSFIRSVVKDALQGQVINTKYAVLSLEDPYLFALLRRVPDLFAHLPQERSQDLIRKYYRFYDEVAAAAPGDVLDWDTYKKYWELESKATWPKKLIQKISSLDFPEEYKFSSEIIVVAKVAPGDYSADADEQVSLWVQKGTPGLSEGISISRRANRDFEISVSGTDWGVIKGKIQAVTYWLYTAKITGTPEAKYSFIMGVPGLVDTQREMAARFMSDNSVALAKYLKVPQKMLQYPEHDIAKLRLIPSMERVSLAKGLLFDLCGGLSWERVHTGGGAYWGTLDSLLVAIKFLDRVLSYNGSLANKDYVLPSTFLYRAGLRGELFQQVRDGLASPTAHKE